MRFAFRLLAGAALAAALAAQPPGAAKGDRSGRFKPGDLAPDFSLKVMHKR